MPDLVTECARCGEALLVPASLLTERDPRAASLVHDVCPRDRVERRFDVVLTVLEDHGDEGVTDLAGFTVSVEAATLRDAVEKASSGLTEKWQRLFETAHLADTEDPDDRPTMPGLDDVRDQETERP